MATISHIKGVQVQHLFQRYVIIQKIGMYILLNRMRNTEQYSKLQRIHTIRTITLNISQYLYNYAPLLKPWYAASTPKYK